MLRGSRIGKEGAARRPFSGQPKPWRRADSVRGHESAFFSLSGPRTGASAPPWIEHRYAQKAKQKTSQAAELAKGPPRRDDSAQSHRRANGGGRVEDSAACTSQHAYLSTGDGNAMFCQTAILFCAPPGAILNLLIGSCMRDPKRKVCLLASKDATALDAAVNNKHSGLVGNQLVYLVSHVLCRTLVAGRE